MKMTDIRRRVLERLQEVAAEADEEALSRFLTHARAVLIALAGRSGDEDVELEGVTVGSRTASLILGMHPEYVRHLIRHGWLKAEKENGEYRIALSDMASPAVARRGPRVGPLPALHEVQLVEVLEKSSAVWQSPKDSES